jgi:hypothetical protein
MKPDNDKIIKLFKFLLMRYISERLDLSIKEIGLRASRIMCRYGFELVVPGINFKVECVSEGGRELQLAFKVLNIENDDPDPWYEINVGAICCQ